MPEIDDLLNKIHDILYRKENFYDQSPLSPIVEDLTKQLEAEREKSKKYEQTLASPLVKLATKVARKLRKK